MGRTGQGVPEGLGIRRASRESLTLRRQAVWTLPSWGEACLSLSAGASQAGSPAFRTGSPGSLLSGTGSLCPSVKGNPGVLVKQRAGVRNHQERRWRVAQWQMGSPCDDRPPALFPGVQPCPLSHPPPAPVKKLQRKSTCVPEASGRAPSGEIPPTGPSSRWGSTSRYAVFLQSQGTLSASDKSPGSAKRLIYMGVSPGPWSHCSTGPRDP